MTTQTHTEIDIIGILPKESFEVGSQGGYLSYYEISPTHFKQLTGSSIDIIHMFGKIEIKKLSIKTKESSPIVASIGTMEDGEFVIFEPEKNPVALLRRDGLIVRGHCSNVFGEQKSIKITVPRGLSSDNTWCFYVSTDSLPEFDVFFSYKLKIPIN